MKFAFNRKLALELGGSLIVALAILYIVSGFPLAEVKIVYQNF